MLDFKIILRVYTQNNMNFSPFSTHFPGIHQFVSTTQDNATNNSNANRYNNASNNTSNNLNFNQTKFRSNELETTNAVSINKYVNQTATTAQYGTVSYSQSNDSKNNITLPNTNNYQTMTTSTQQLKDNSDLTQDITALLQQTDTKRGDF